MVVRGMLSKELDITRAWISVFASSRGPTIRQLAHESPQPCDTAHVRPYIYGLHLLNHLWITPHPPSRTFPHLKQHQRQLQRAYPTKQHIRPSKPQPLRDPIDHRDQNSTKRTSHQVRLHTAGQSYGITSWESGWVGNLHMLLRPSCASAGCRC